MSGPTVNGEKPSSQFISHLASLPVVSDSISTFKSNPYGKKSIELADTGYAKFAKPVLPYLSGPYGYVSPYVHKVDSIADSGLGKVEETFPIVKEDTEKLKDNVISVAFFPLHIASQGQEYLFNTYNSEYKKVGGEGIVTTGKTVVSTGLHVTSDVLGWLGSWLGPKKEAAKDKINEKTNN
ncbi:MAG: hypothetical protein M1819_007011 [Sarea resinae]|nr:MAG: hypothetical protein M1819_007011 [Sarea resinae]